MKRPSFQFYPKDLLSDSSAMAMPNEALGMYWKLLCHDWINDGIPDDSKVIMRIANFDFTDFQGNMREPEDYTICLSHLRSCFIAHPSKKGFLTNPRLMDERKKQDEFLQERSDSGKKGASKRWNLANCKQNKSNGSANGLAIKEPMAKHSSSSPSSSPNIKEINKEKSCDDPIWVKFTELCSELGLENSVSPTLYLQTVSEYSRRGQTFPEVKDCLYWCKDKGKRQITTMRIRNWLKNWARGLKEKELKQLATQKDQSEGDREHFIKAKLPPLWKEPV